MRHKSSDSQKKNDLIQFDTVNDQGNCPPSRREYFKQYYLKNREKARAYQRLYNLKHRKKIDLTRLSIIQKREPIQQTFTIRDLTFSTTEKSIKMFNLILSQERYLSLSIPKKSRIYRE